MVSMRAAGGAASKPDEAEIWDLHNHRAGRREGAEREKTRARMAIEEKRRQNMQARGRGSVQESVGQREENGVILAWRMKCSRANTICKNGVIACVKDKWCVVVKKGLCVWLGSRQEGKGVSEHALFGLTLDAGLASLRLAQKHTQQAVTPTTLHGTERTWLN